MKNYKQIGKLLLLITVFVVSASFAKAQLNTAESIIEIDAPDNDRHYKINEPNVRQRTTDYPTIMFKPGDTVKFRAGGCVQTGGKGKTWKRYVLPFGPNSDRLYRGMILIPGLTTNSTFLSNFLNGDQSTSPWSQELKIPIKASLENPHLTLGYTDDNYDDNGYYDRDEGTNKQCQGSVNAWFEIYIHPE